MKKIPVLLIFVILMGFTACKSSSSPGEKTYTITFNDNGGSGGPTTVTAHYGQPMPTLTGQQIPAQSGYYFNGYYKAQTGGTMYYNADLSSATNWNKRDDTTLFARWISIADYYGFTNIGNDDYFAHFTKTAPVIDGIGDDPAWEKSPWRPISYEWMYNPPYSRVKSPEDFSGKYKIVWTADRLYILAEIIDDIISTTRANTPYTNPENDDCLELFISENTWNSTRITSASQTMPNNFFTYHISFGGVNVADYIGSSYNRTNTTDVNLRVENGSILRNNHLNYKIGKHPETHTYIWEIEMKVFDNTHPINSNPDTAAPVTLTEGKKMGFAAAYCDADELNTRQHFVGSMFVSGDTDDQRNQAYRNAGIYAKLYLVK
ncbi:MAG: InlB B-repeat-containing protein [Treponema sp.]|jgi:hypothetical protein|nr:InlB B-repeat-containing protein [Treponema sp.]